MVATGVTNYSQAGHEENPNRVLKTSGPVTDDEAELRHSKEKGKKVRKELKYKPDGPKQHGLKEFESKIPGVFVSPPCTQIRERLAQLIERIK